MSITTNTTPETRYIMDAVPTLASVGNAQLGALGIIVDGPYYGANKLYPGAMRYHWRVAFDNGVIGWVTEETLSLPPVDP